MFLYSVHRRPTMLIPTMMLHLIAEARLAELRRKQRPQR